MLDKIKKMLFKCFSNNKAIIKPLSNIRGNSCNVYKLEVNDKKVLKFIFPEPVDSSMLSPYSSLRLGKSLQELNIDSIEIESNYVMLPFGYELKTYKDRKILCKSFDINKYKNVIFVYRNDGKYKVLGIENFNYLIEIDIWYNVWNDINNDPVPVIDKTIDSVVKSTFKTKSDIPVVYFPYTNLVYIYITSY
jgi:hypothetical protein